MAELTQEQKGKVVLVISELFDVPEEKIREFTDLRDELGVDSLDQIELEMRLEEEFACNLSYENFEYAKTVNDIYKILSQVI